MGGGAVGKDTMELQRLSKTQTVAGSTRNESVAILRQTAQGQLTLRQLKRFGDILGALVGLTLCLPLFLLIALAIRLDSPGPILFRHRRMGRNRKPFKVLKFRTMVDEAEILGPEVTIATDGRITRVGAFLRRTKLDELPQLWNVLVGEMSLVGPRPQSFSFLPYYSDEDLDLILSVLPGITGPTQLWLRNEEEILAKHDNPIDFYTLTLLPQKITSDRNYVKTWSLLGDCRILLLTVCTLLRIRSINPQPPEQAVVVDEGQAGDSVSARIYERVV